MFIKNALVYNFTKLFDTSAEQIADALMEHTFRPCASMDSQKQGWVCPVPNGESFTHSAAGNILICLKTQEKTVPASYVKSELNKLVSDIEAERDQKVGKKEKQTLKEEVIQRLLPQAFPKDTFTYAYIDMKGQRIIVDASSPNKAENLLAYLRQSLGSLPILPMKPEGDLIVTLTNWVKEDSTPSPFLLGSKVELKALDDEAANAKLDSHDLSEEEVQLHIANGKYVHKLALVWDEKIKFILDNEGHLKQVKFLDVIKEQTEDIPSEDKLAKFDADFALMAGELNQLLDNLVAEYNGAEG